MEAGPFAEGNPEKTSLAWGNGRQRAIKIDRMGKPTQAHTLFHFENVSVASDFPPVRQKNNRMG